MNCPDDLEVDHIHHNLLDNRKSKLRIATSSQQKMNTKLRKDNTSGHRGIYFDSDRQKWAVHLKDGNKRVAKRFNSYDDAVKYCEAKLNEIHQSFKYQEITITYQCLCSERRWLQRMPQFKTSAMPCCKNIVITFNL